MEKHGKQWEKSHNSKLRLMHAAHDLFELNEKSSTKP